MTCIAAYRDINGDIYMGGDSIGIANYTYVTITEPKVFRQKNMLFGFESSFRMGQILQYDFDIPLHDKKLCTYQYLISIFIPSIISIFENTKFARIDNNQIEGGTFLIGYNKRIFEIQNDFQVIEINSYFTSIGCGEEFAKGSFWTLEKQKTKMSPETKVETALKCASSFSLVKEPFHIIKLPHDAGLNN